MGRPIEKEEGVNKTLSVVLAIVAALLLAGVVYLGVRLRDTSARYAETLQSEEDVRSQFNSALLSIAEIQDSLNAIVPAEEEVLDLTRSAEGGVTQTQKDQMLGTIDGLRQSIDRNKARIRDLESDLRRSGQEVAGLSRIIENLKESVAQKERTIRVLTARVDSLTTTVAGLREDVRRGEETITAQQTVIERKQQEIGRVFYIVGTRDELKEKGLVTQRGGVLGIGKSTVLTGQFRESDFEEVDTDVVREIRFEGKKPEVLSAQARSSYQLRPEGDATVLEIQDPAEFRKVKYLVIMIED